MAVNALSAVFALVMLSGFEGFSVFDMTCSNEWEGSTSDGSDEDVRQLDLQVLLLIGLVFLAAGDLLQLAFRQLDGTFRGGLHQALRDLLGCLFGHCCAPHSWKKPALVV
jgi:hypothetical protein